MRRQLAMTRLDEATAESESLLASGYSRSGNWSLAQICLHLRLTIETNMHGYPRWMTILGLPLRPILRSWVLPKLLAGDSPSGIRTANIFIPPDDVDDAKEVDRFKTCVASFLESRRPMHAHPGFGSMTNQEFDHFHAAHAAHHLSFLHPTTIRRG
ncbi:MAG: DUF1569 domain-containing protein [Planctomycetota bacterium]